MSKPSTSGLNETILRSVEKPGRYTGGEWNAVRKDPTLAKVRVALAFPDAYEIGMSYLGQKILYDLLNRRPGVLAERVFAPWPDCEQALRSAGVPLASLESGIPLGAFDIVGFSLLYELNYSNILTMLDLAGLPFRAAERGEDAPLVIAGGPSAFNPEPVAEIFDLFAIGDGEEAFPEILDIYLKARTGGATRAGILEALARRPGFYVPALWEPHRPPDSPLLAVRPKPGDPEGVTKRVFPGFARSTCPTDIVVPNIQTVFDRVAVEVARGCPRKCRFCQATSLYAPYRVKDPGAVIASVFGSVAATGYENASLFALSVGDYPYLEETVRVLMDGLEEERVALSLSSLRPKSLSADIARAITRVRKTGFTIVPEAGSERLRRVVNKDLAEEEILDAAANAFREGWRLLKLYAMIGLPTETPGDVEALCALVEKISAVGRGILGGGPEIHLSVSSFIPKPHTPFQWAGMAGEDVLRERQGVVKRGLRRLRNVDVRDHPVESSFLEAVFSRGDRRLAAVLIRAWRKGARFDSWTDHFRPGLWREAIAEEGLDPRDYLGPIDREAVLPWDHIRTGVPKAFLAREFDRAMREERTAACAEEECPACGGCDFGPGAAKSLPAAVGAAAPPRAALLGTPSEDLLRYAVVFVKEGRARFFGHQDLLNVIQRTLRRARIRPAYSEGFHPKMRLAFPPPLPLGMEGRQEIFEFRAGTDLETGECVEALNRHAPPGLRFIGLEKIPPDLPPLHRRILAVDYSLRLDDECVRAAIERLRAERGRPEASAADILGELAAASTGSGLGVPEKIAEASTEARVLMRYPFDPARPPRPQDFVGRALDLPHASHVLIRERFVLA
jgi:radical SAM family uncharacterized protein